MFGERCGLMFGKIIHRNKRYWTLSLTLVCLILGFIIALQLRAQENLEATPLLQKNKQLVSVIRKTEQEIDSLEKQISEARENIQQQESSLHDEKGQAKQAKAELQKLQVLAGATPVTGEGLIITLDDNKKGKDSLSDVDPNWFIIHSTDILRLINELKNAGAEAIAVNGQRIVTTSEVRCVGNTIMINTTRMSPPYQVEAIGNPAVLKKALLENGRGIIYELKSLDFPVSIVEAKDLQIAAYKKSYNFQHIKVVQTN